MSRMPSPRRGSDGLTGDLFAGIPEPAPATAGSMDFRSQIAQLTSKLLQGTTQSRYQVAARMSELADVETSKALLDSYTSESREASNLPLWKAPIIEIVADNRSLAEWHAGVLGGRVLWGAEVLDAEMGRYQRLIQEMQAEFKALQRMRRVVR